MYKEKEYNTLRMVSKITSGFGWIIAGIFALFGLITGWSAGGFLAGIIGGIVCGVLLGVPFVIGGQMISVFLDQKELLADILETMKKS